MKNLPLILIPGLLSDAEVFAHQCQHLKNVEIIIPDLNHADTPEKMVQAVLDVAPPQFALGGHSMGGWVAVEIMKVAPERVLKLALLNTIAKPDSLERHKAREAMIAQAETGDYAPIIDKMVDKFIYNTAISDSARAMFERNKFAFVNQEKAILKRRDCLAVLETISCPTLIIHAENDANFDFSESQVFSEKIKFSTLLIIKNSGHMSPMEAPQEITEKIQAWLDK